MTGEMNDRRRMTEVIWGRQMDRNTTDEEPAWNRQVDELGIDAY